jgi:NitT/TauT family transport system ATP-binding protein
MTGSSGNEYGTGARQGQVVFENVTLEYSGRPAIESVSFTVDRGHFVSVIGPSGCGKSTVLNLCAGLLQPTTGTVRYKSSIVSGISQGVGYVTQESNLLPWLTVAGNIGLPLKLQGVEKGARERLVADWVGIMNLRGFENYFPRALSGGMRKRVSLARAMITDPSIILMDEPFGPLDAITRMKLQQELMNLCQESERTIIFVTHDLAEAVSLSDEVVVMTGSPGRVKAVFDVPIDKPRTISQLYDEMDFSQLTKKLWELFEADASVMPEARARDARRPGRNLPGPAPQDVQATNIPAS